MKTFLVVICIWAWGLFLWFSSAANANDYNKAVIGHVIQTEIQGNSIDASVLEAEIQKIAHTFSLEMISAFEKHLPSILDSISAELRAKTDKTYKCALQSDEYKNKDCNE
mgnify:CR=1 FL=1